MSIFHRKRHIIDNRIFADIDRLLAELEPQAGEEFVAAENNVYYDMTAAQAMEDYDPSWKAVESDLEDTGALYDANELKPHYAPSYLSGSLDLMLANADDTFQQHLLKLIDSRGLKDSYVYRKAEVDRRLFSKIRSNVNYRPKKLTVISLCLALELNIDETTDLLKRAGYALSESSRQDIIIRYCIEHKIYDLTTVNDILIHYDQPLIGAAE